MRISDWSSDVCSSDLARLGDKDAVLLAELGSAHLGRGAVASATRLTAAAHALVPLAPAIADAYGWALFKAGDRAAARQLLAQAVATAPDHTENGRAACRRRGDQYMESMVVPGTLKKKK